MRMMLVYITYIINLISRQWCVSKWSFRGRSLLAFECFWVFAVCFGTRQTHCFRSVYCTWWCICLHAFLVFMWVLAYIKSWSLIVGTLVGIRPAPLLLDQPNTSSSSLHWPKESMNIYNRFSISCLLCLIYYFGSDVQTNFNLVILWSIYVYETVIN